MLQEMAGQAGNGWKWLGMIGIFWKYLKKSENNFIKKVSTKEFATDCFTLLEPFSSLFEDVTKFQFLHVLKQYQQQTITV